MSYHVDYVFLFGFQISPLSNREKFKPTFFFATIFSTNAIKNVGRTMLCQCNGHNIILLTIIYTLAKSNVVSMIGWVSVTLIIVST